MKKCNNWNMPWDDLIGLWLFYYMPVRFVIILLFLIKMKIKKQNIISYNSTKTKRLIVINIFLNIFSLIGGLYDCIKGLSSM